MNDEAKSKSELISELVELRRQLVERDAAELERTKSFYRDILESIVSGVSVSGPDDVIEYANRGMEQIVGAATAQICGMHALTGFPEETLREFRPCYILAKETLELVFYDAVPVTTPAGRQIYQSGWLIPRVRDGHYDGMICTVEDVTEHKRLEQRLADERNLCVH